MEENQLQQSKKLIIIKCGGAYISHKSAGSFGHHEAKSYQITSGFKSRESAEGITKTRESVTKLLNIVTTRLLNEKLDVVPISPFSSWLTENEKVIKDNSDIIQQSISLNLIPILHGDVCLDTVKGCTILSGDIIIQVLSKKLKPFRTIFITDVEGLYNESPKENKDAKLIYLIEIPRDLINDDSGSANIKSRFDHIIGGSGQQQSNNTPDVTGGMKAKITSACNIASYGINTLDGEAYFELNGLGNTFIIKLNNQSKIEQARRIISGQEQIYIYPMGKIIKEKIWYNPQWDYYMDPSTIYFVGIPNANCDFDFKTVNDQLACIYSALLLHDDGIEITDDKIKTLLKAANVEVAPHWPGLYARLLKKTNIKDLLLNAGSSAAAAAPAATPAAAAAAPAAAAKKEEPKKKEEKKEESDEDMGMGLFD
eukprot:gene4145-5186_t